MFHSALVEEQSRRAHQQGCEYPFVGGGENDSQRAVDFDKAVHDERHTEGVDHVVQQENRPGGLANQPQFAEKDGGGKEDNQTKREKDRDAGGEGAFQNGAVEKIIIVRQMPS